MRIKNFYLYLILLILPLIFSSCADSSGGDIDTGHVYTVTVMLIPCEGMTVESENPVRVEPGTDAVFSVTLREDMQVDRLSGGAVYSDGKVTVPAVVMPLTVMVSGSVRVTEVIEETTAPPTVVGEPMAAELSTPEGYYLIVYHANGGVHKAPVTKTMTIYGSGTLAQQFDAAFYLCPNALADKGYFKRPGYALLGYNTMADGSGDFYACGWNIIMPESRALDLWAVWAAETPAEEFEFTVANGKAAIKSYKGNADTVVIPESYGSVPVTSVLTKAFSGAACTSVYLTRGLEVVEKYAFMNCDNLTTLYLSDSITTINDASFSGCKNLSTLIISAVRDPAYTTNKHGTYAVKYELLYTAKGRKVLVINGSNTAYGLDSVFLMDSLDFDATVVNFGFNWNVPTLMQMEIAERFASPGDILLLAPEMAEAQFGGVKSYTTMWQLFESCYEAVSYMNIQNYTGVLDTFSSFNQTRKSMTARSYEDYVKDVNIYGDYTIFRKAQAADYNYTGQPNLDFNRASYLTDQRVERMNAMFDSYRDKGCYVWMSFSSINQNGLSAQSKDAAYRAAWVEALTAKLHVTIISVLDDYIYPGDYFFDSNFHLSTEATKIRTAKLAEDMNRAYAALPLKDKTNEY